MAITNKQLNKIICKYADIFSNRMAKESWLNYDLSWIKRYDEPKKDDVLVIVVRGDLIPKAEKMINKLCNSERFN